MLFGLLFRKALDFALYYAPRNSSLRPDLLCVAFVGGADDIIQSMLFPVASLSIGMYPFVFKSLLSLIYFNIFR